MVSAILQSMEWFVTLVFGIFVWLPIPIISAQRQGFRRVCYFASWSIHREVEEARFDIDYIEPDLCTHLIYAFAKIDPTSLTLTPWDETDINNGVDLPNYNKFNDIKERNSNLKTLLSVGGHTAGTNQFIQMVATKKRRVKFILSAIDILRTYGFNGIDIDWEFPRSHDRAQFTELIKEFREAFEKESKMTKRPRLILTAAVGVNENQITYSYDVAQISKYLDFFNVMTYDFHGHWQSYLGFNSPLFSRNSQNRKFSHSLSQEWVINRYIQAGAPRHKLVLGMAMQGRSFTLANPRATMIGAKATGPGYAGRMTREKGVMSYFEICELERSGEGSLQWDSVQMCPYFHKGDFWIGYDNRRSIAIKTAWLVKNKLGGAMVWSIDLDDYQGTFCNEGTYPLIRTIQRVQFSKSPHTGGELKRGRSNSGAKYNAVDRTINVLIALVSFVFTQWMMLRQ
ncbi:unnamed protein product [Owenia fusiformis]|uniref:Uncharacterized protein n=1 Tax=Owenia fusiformis TaxID=6347 RepID=A0A8J1TTJ6_OWEFU|nr:unnamed protein product [Owenia fusiformis]